MDHPVESNRSDMERLYTVAEVQSLLSIGRSQAYALIEQKQIPVVRIGRSLRVKEQDLKHFVESNRQG